jgi:hypothetical protein
MFQTATASPARLPAERLIQITGIFIALISDFVKMKLLWAIARSAVGDPAAA